jgi:hypothetical protein
LFDRDMSVAWSAVKLRSATAVLAALSWLAGCDGRGRGGSDATASLRFPDGGWALSRPADSPRVRSVRSASPFTLGLTDPNTIARVRRETPECRLNPLLQAVARQAVTSGCAAESRDVRALPTLLLICQHQEDQRRCLLQYTAELWGEGLVTSTRAYDIKLFGRLAWLCPDDAHLEDAMEPPPEAKTGFAQMTSAIRTLLEACQ